MALLAACGGSGGDFGDAIHLSGKIITMNSEGSTVQAVVVQGDVEIIGAGSLKTMKKDFRARRSMRPSQTR
ncbi:MAG: hypothetical protein R3B98_06850 [Hyphomonas sp.]